MPTQRNLMGTGCPAPQAQASVGIPTAAFNLGGTGQSDAPLMSTDLCIATTTTGSNYGCIVPAAATGAIGIGDTYILVNHSGQTAKVYPISGGKIANASANTAFSVTTGKTAIFNYIGSDNWGASLSA
jgi:hypothetical protein